MPIIKIHHRENPFAQIDKAAIANPNLSWKAKGILAYLLTLPPDWNINLSELEEHATDGKEATRNAFHEIEKAGHVTREKIRLANGRIGGLIFNVFEEPLVFQLENEPATGKPATTNKDSTNKENTLIKDNNIKKPKKADGPKMNTKEANELYEYWKKVTDSYPHRGRFYKAIREPLIDRGLTVCMGALVEYMKERKKDNYQYASPENFKTTFGQWVRKNTKLVNDPTSD